jgi:aldehyde dehydrogenase (NAD+)
VIIDQSANLRTAAETLMWGKFFNCGQTCVAPDHVYVHETVKDAFVAECRKVLAERYGEGDKTQASPHFARVINQRHTQRINGLLDDAKAKGARVLVGGQVDTSTCFIAPTLIDQVPQDAAIMTEEVFGPVFPVIPWRDLNQVIASINAGPKPLALYIWSKTQGTIDRIKGQTSSGGVAINHCVLQFSHGNLPFGGVNNSGIGNSHGYFGFKAFSHERGVLKSGPIMGAKMFFPPYDGNTPKIIRLVVDSMKWPKLF